MPERISPPSDMVGREAEWRTLVEFATAGHGHATLAVVWGRRRIGKSFLLSSLVDALGGIYFEATRGSSVEALRELGAAIAAHQGAAAPLALSDWPSAIEALLRIASETETLIVLDEFPYLLEHTPELDSIIQRAFGPRNPLRTSTRARLVLCGSAMSVMGKLQSGTAPLRGRASLELRLSPFDFRTVPRLYDVDDRALATRIYAIIGGVAAYARDMIDHDLPRRTSDFGRWIGRRVLSPSSPLLTEVTTLLSEDPVTSKARKLNLYHAALAGVALGNHAHSRLTSYVKVSGASLSPIIEGLVAAQLIERIEDPLRDNRPMYHPADPLLRFHYAIIRPNHSRLSRHGVDVSALWQQLQPSFSSNVLGPTFEAMARAWSLHWADPATLGGEAAHVGPSVIEHGGQSQELDVVVAADDGSVPAERTVLAIGEAKVAQSISTRHLHRLEEARTALGERASSARLLCFGGSFTDALGRVADERTDIELIDLDRLYDGS